jgi:hypothetical protein
MFSPRGNNMDSLKFINQQSYSPVQDSTIKEERLQFNST